MTEQALVTDTAGGGDPGDVARTAQAAMEVARFDVEQAQARLAAAQQYAQRQVELLAAHDPHHPLYTAPGDPHWHVQTVSDGDVESFITVFHALHYAADRLDDAASFEVDIAASTAALADQHEDRYDHATLAALYQEAVAAHTRAERYDNLAENARVSCHNATQPPWMRAPLYRSEDEAANRAKLLTYARSRVDSINADGPGLRVWECPEPECAPREDDEG